MNKKNCTILLILCFKFLISLAICLNTTCEQFYPKKISANQFMSISECYKIKIYVISHATKSSTSVAL